MARAPGPSERCGTVSLQLPVGHDVGLAEETSLHAAELDLVTQGGCADAEFGSGLGRETATHRDGACLCYSSFTSVSSHRVDGLDWSRRGGMSAIEVVDESRRWFDEARKTQCGRFVDQTLPPRGALVLPH
jgi:hypothetical protein